MTENEAAEIVKNEPRWAAGGEAQNLQAAAVDALEWLQVLQCLIAENRVIREIDLENMTRLSGAIAALKRELEIETEKTDD